MIAVLSPAAPVRSEPGEQLRLVGWWCAGAIGGLFALTALFDVALIFLLPLLALAFALAALALLIRGVTLGWRMRRDRRGGLLVASAMPLAGLTFALVALPAGRLGGLVQAHGVLLLNQGRYEQLIAGRPTAQRMRTEWAQVAGSGSTRLWAFGYGGWLGWDKDIVFDPRDHPEARAVRSFGAAEASCRRLRSHFYDCLLDY